MKRTNQLFPCLLNIECLETVFWFIMELVYIAFLTSIGTSLELSVEVGNHKILQVIVLQQELNINLYLA